MRDETPQKCHRLVFNYFQDKLPQVWYHKLKTVEIERDTYGEDRH